MARFKVDQDYRHLRAAEYPPVTDFVDAQVKGDEAAAQRYLEQCRAVKAKFPKPEAGQ